MSPERTRAFVVVAALCIGSAGATCAIGARGRGPADAAFASLGLELCVALAALAGGLLSARPLADRLGLRRGRLAGRDLLVVVVGTLGLSHGLDGLLEATGLRQHSSLAELQRLLADARGLDFALVLLGVGLAPGIAEELLCRGLVQRGAERRLGPWPAAVVGAGVFGLLHVDPVHAAFAGVLGLYLGAVAVWAHSIRASMLCHVLNNVVAVATAGLPEIGPPGPLGSALGFAVAAASLWRLARQPAQGSRGGESARPALQREAGSDDP